MFQRVTVGVFWSGPHFPCFWSSTPFIAIGCMSTTMSPWEDFCKFGSKHPLGLKHELIKSGGQRSLWHPPKQISVRNSRLHTVATATFYTNIWLDKNNEAMASNIQKVKGQLHCDIITLCEKHYSIPSLRDRSLTAACRQTTRRQRF